jgi:predicted transglutaminase-like cysteine proteinase
MTQDLTFKGFNCFTAGPDDPIRKKWDSVRNNLDVLMSPIKVNLTSVEIVNRSINRIVRYTKEPDGVDVWQAPSFTWINAKGDCEDYAILKYALLLKSGLPHECLRIVVGEIAALSGNRPHAWCAVFISDVWYVMDQMFDRIIPVAEYVNWAPVATAHGDTVLGWGRQIVMSEIMGDRK